MRYFTKTGSGLSESTRQHDLRFVGKIVHYTLTAKDAQFITDCRDDGPPWFVEEGDVFPFVIVTTAACADAKLYGGRVLVAGKWDYWPDHLLAFAPHGVAAGSEEARGRLTLPPV